MKTSFLLIICILALAAFPLPSFAQPKFPPPTAKLPDEKTMELIREGTLKLKDALAAMPAKTPDYVLVDIEIHLKALEWAVRHNDIFDGGKAALTVLDQGLQRAKEGGTNATWLVPQGKIVARGYRSKVDGSVQPYAVAYPADYGKDPSKKWRLDITLHGRDGTICETKFLASHSPKDTPKTNDFVQIDIYGRGNNAYRWAGETDIWEVIENFIAVEKQLGRDLIDPKRHVIRGFSMGGAGSWHLGLHHPGAWCVMGPGAGFTETHNYVPSLKNPLPDYQELLLHIYDAVDYAANAFNIPIVAYSGEKDAQKTAADNIEKRLQELKINTMTHLIGPGLAHAFPAEWQKKAEEEYVKYAGPAKGRAAGRKEIRFTTYTLKYPKCDWVVIEQLEKHYELASVDAKREGDTLTVATKNIARLFIDLPAFGEGSYKTIVLDGVKLESSATGKYVHEKGKWAAAVTPPVGLVKEPGSQGPIDDAFTTAFLCVKGSGTAWNDGLNKAAEAQLQRFEREWDKWMRGKLVIKTDKEVTEEDIKNKNLILFGDPGSNTLIAKTLPKLPLTWTKDLVVLGTQKYDAAKDLPMLIYPNPLNPRRYVVFNSGHTFHEEEFRGTNALLFPRLGDYAVVRPAPTTKDAAAFEVIHSGIFDESWKVLNK
ncbi:MAG: hypothetical protein K8T89_03250 [Planctomycetes bacterium]|nr:hypothetical protein [Planctomycetota bacterium]